MRFIDKVRVLDRGVVAVVDKLKGLVQNFSWSDPEWDKPIVQVEGWVEMVMRERGKLVPGSHREGKNIWTNTGREYLAMLMSIQTGPSTTFRSDSIAYIGVGTGSQVEDPGVTSLVAPTAYAAGLFLASLDTPPTFPLTPTRTTVKYHRLFTESQITVSPGSTVLISEAGLFTNGRQADYLVGARDLTIGNASAQAPMAYKAFEPLGKKDTLQLDVSWEIRF